MSCAVGLDFPERALKGWFAVTLLFLMVFHDIYEIILMFEMELFLIYVFMDFL